jgi:hypothetical protein
LIALRFGNGLFAFLAKGYQTSSIWVSSDAIGWQRADAPANFPGFAAAGNRFFVLPAPGTNFYSSSDCVNWENHTFGTNVSISDVIFAQGTYVAVGNVILQSDPVTNSPPSPATLSINSLPGISITGTVGQRYRIEYTEDLANTNSFQPLTNILLTVSPFLWVDTTATNSPRRFYRAVLVP